MPNARSHHCLEIEKHILVAVDHVAREARYRTLWDDGSETETIHVLYWENNPKEGTGGEVRSMPKELYPTVQPLVTGAELKFADLVGRDTLPHEAAALLQALGGIDKV